jgi:hypothetical protein
MAGSPERIVVLLLAVFALALAPCSLGERGDSSRPPGRPPVVSNHGLEQELFARISAAIRAWPGAIIGRAGEEGLLDVIAYSDLAAAREQLGLPKHADSLAPERHPLLYSFASRPLFLFGTLFDPGGPRPVGPLAEVLDGGQIDAAVGMNHAFSGPGADQVGRRSVVVLRTRQPFDEIADRLRRREGYESANGLLLGERIDPDDHHRIPAVYDGFPFPAVADAGGGVVVLGGSAQAARAALAGEGAELTPAAELVAELPGVSLVAYGEAPLGFSCVVTFGMGEHAVPREGVLLAVVDAKAEAERFRYGGQYPGPSLSFEGEIRFAEPTVQGERVSTRFTSTDELTATRADGVEGIANVYRCP